LGCFAIRKKGIIHNHQQYIKSLENNALRNNDYNSQIILGFHSKLMADTGSAIHWWLMAEKNMLNSKRNILLPAVVQFNLGEAWESGHLRSGSKNSSSNNLMEAAKWFDRSASQEYVPAMLKIGKMYETGIGARKSHSAASGWYGKAAESGSLVGMRKLGIVMYDGMKEAIPNPTTAARWWKEASDKGDPESMVLLGKSFTNGVGVIHDDREAFNLFQQAADMGNGEAMFYLGEAHRTGKGPPKRNVEQCVHWYKLAAKNGYAVRANGELRLLGAVSPTSGGDVVRYVQRPTTCHYCDKDENVFDDVMIMCRRCNSVGYCSDMCKHLDFRKSHKMECGLISVQREVTKRETEQTDSFVMETNLDWQEYETEDGDKYWYNNKTAESSWNDPRGVLSGSPNNISNTKNDHKK